MVELRQFNLSQFISFKTQHWEQSIKVRSIEVRGIEVKRFINFDLDTFGWYALGHFDNKTFLAIIDQKEALRTPSYKIRRVWAQWEDNELQETTFFAPNAEPVTILEFYA